MTDIIYRVLRDGIRQRVGSGFRDPKVGDLINVSDKAAGLLLRDGWIEMDIAAMTGAPVLAAVRCPDHPRYQGKSEPRDCEACRRVRASAAPGAEEEIAE